MPEKCFSDILCQEQKSPVNAIKSRNFKVDFMKKSAYNVTSEADFLWNRLFKDS